MTEVRVRVADYAVAATPKTIVTIGLGSCVAITLHDPVAGIGGLAHVLLPSEAMSRERENRAKFACTAVPLLIEQMQALGARLARMQAKLAGGAAMFTSLIATPALQMGERNVMAARDALQLAGIPLVGQDVGGDFGRSVYFSVADGTMRIRSVRRREIVV
ncbi:MAG TPA: chemotaxis protein CheD [Gemmatimonadaceae bacterium]|nr:chemotaxis protein CheD [Gemmatimonadaceae bacterium]